MLPPRTTELTCIGHKHFLCHKQSHDKAPELHISAGLLGHLGFSCIRSREKPLWKIYLEGDRLGIRRRLALCVRGRGREIGPDLDYVVPHRIHNQFADRVQSNLAHDVGQNLVPSCIEGRIEIFPTPSFVLRTSPGVAPVPKNRAD